MRRGAFLITLVLAVAVAVAGSGAHARGSAFRAQSITITQVPHYGLVTRAALDWCGTGQPTAVDRKPDLDLSSARQVHVTYAIPADAADQLTVFAPKIATDAAAMDTWWRGQDSTRTIRFDLFAFPGCATKLGRLDVGFIRLPRAGALYVGDSGLDRLVTDLAQLGAVQSQKHLVYYDGPSPFDSLVCGTTSVPSTAPTQGGFAGIAFVWLRSLCGGDVGAGGLNAATAVHELIHGLGALVGANSPNECPPPDDGHVCDSPSDILYPSVTSSSRIATQVLDVNRDDYYGHSRPWFDVQDSGWLTHLPQLVLNVSLQRAGGSAGVVHMTAPTAFDCAAPCGLELDTGTTATLVAQAAAGARFVGWTGACSGAGPCAVTMDAAKNITARFTAAASRINVSVSGKGRVTSTPAGIACPKRCSTTFPTTSTVRLRAKPASGQRFTGWSGSCHGIGTCTLNANRNRSAHATFKKKP